MSKFKPIFNLTAPIVNDLLRIEVAKERISSLPLTISVLASLRESAKLSATHYSTMIEGNRLSSEQVKEVIQHKKHIPHKKRDELEVLGYYKALTMVEQWVQEKKLFSENLIQSIHGFVMGGGKTKIVPTPYRSGQNVIKDGATGAIVYLPPEAQDVQLLMQELVEWVIAQDDLAVPVKAALVHYQFATIHPYYDGNGRTARLLALFILYQGGYDLKKIYSLESYYAQNLPAYYEAISVGPSHNYYEGRAESDLTHWIRYFCAGMADAVESVEKHMNVAEHRGYQDDSEVLRQFDPLQKIVLILFKKEKYLTNQQISEVLQISTQVGALLCKKWVASGFIEYANSSKKARKYQLTKEFEDLIVKKII